MSTTRCDAFRAFAMSFVGAALVFMCGSRAHAAGTGGNAAQTFRQLVAGRATGPIKIDGVLDESDWKGAPIADAFIQNEPREGEPASDETEVRVLHDEQNLYFGVFARDREPGRIIVTDLREDFAGTDGDVFELVLDTFRDKRNGYLFAVNPGGAKADAQMANEGRETNWSWDGVWFVRSHIGEEGWYAEIAIPFRTLKFDSTSQQTWGVNFHRRVRRRNEDSFWAPLPRIFGLSRVSMAGTLEGLQGLRPGRDLRLKPYALASYADSAASAGARDGDAGIDIKYGLTSRLTWDFTYNTDFAQAEADEQQINLSRFSLFFPEKRDFFLENSGVFQFGVAQDRAVAGGGGGGRQDVSARNDVILFYSRQIGLSQTGNAIPILAGTRLTGRVGAYSLGVLNIQQRALNLSPGTNFTALRLRRNVFANSDIGVMMLNKDESGARYNRVVGADGNFRFFRNLNINGNVTKAASPRSSAAPGEGRDVMVNARSTYQGKVWDFRGSFSKIGERFNDEMGYVPRVGITKEQAFAAPHLRWKSTSGWLRETWPHWEFSNVTRSNGALDSRYYDYHWPFVLQNGGFLEVGMNRSVEGLARPFRINARRNVTIPTGEYGFNDYFVSFRTNTSARFFTSGRYGLGNFYDGYKHVYEGGVGARFSKQVNITANYSRNVISLPGGAFTTNLLTSRIVYSLSTRMFLNALLQYNTDARQWTSNVRFNIIHRPLSDFFLVYNEQRDTLTDALIGRALIAKVTYMMAF